MKKELFKELKYIGITFIVALVAFKIAFYKEGFLQLIRNVASLFFLFVIPGYCLLLYWQDKFSLTERLIAGTLFAAAVMGIISYYLGIIGISINIHTVLLPIAFIGIGLFFYTRK